MFTKNRPNETGVPQPAASPLNAPEMPSQHGGTDASMPKPATAVQTQPAAAKSKPAPSVLSSDLTIVGNVKSSGDIQVEGTVEGDIRSAVLIVGESATVKGEIVAEEVIVNGRVVGRLRGLKVRLAATSRVEGDIIHKTIAIESGAHFEGSVQRQDDPLAEGGSQPARLSGPSAVRSAGE